MDSNDLREVVNRGGVNFKEKLAELKAKGVMIHPVVWDTMYLYLADYLSVINLLCSYYIKKGMAISVVHAKRIQEYNRKSCRIVDLVLHPDKIKDDEVELLKMKVEASKLGLEIKDFLSHYVSNRLNTIGMIIDDSIDPIDPNPISLDSARRVYDDSSQIISIFEGIRKELQGIERVQV